MPGSPEAIVTSHSPWDSTCWGCRLRGHGGAGNTLTAAPSTYWEPCVVFNHTPGLFSSRLGSYSKQGISARVEVGKKDLRPPDSSWWFYQLSCQSDHRRGAERSERCPIKALTDERSKTWPKTLLMVQLSPGQKRL